MIYIFVGYPYLDLNGLADLQTLIRGNIPL